jgi:hypothetical protein
MFASMNSTHTNTETSAVKVTRKIKKSEIKRMILEREKTLPRLEANADEFGRCWESEKLGFTDGYIHALKVILGGDEPNWDFMGK